MAGFIIFYCLRSFHDLIADGQIHDLEIRHIKQEEILSFKKVRFIALEQNQADYD